MNLSQSTRLTLASIGLFALGAVAACGNAESIEELTPVPADQIADNDATLAPVAELKRDFPGDDALPFEGKADVVLPAKFDLLTLQTPVKNQSRRGVCSIFSTTGLMEMLYKKAGFLLPNPDFSEQYLQWSVKNEVKAFTTTSGSSDYYNLQAISKYGIVDEATWAYQPNPWTEADDPACKGSGDGLPTKCYTNGEPTPMMKAATKYKLPAGRWVSTTSIKNVLFEKKTGVVVGLDFFYQAWNHRLSPLPVNATSFASGYVLYPNAQDKTESNKMRAGHSVQLVGWDDNLEIQTVDAMGKAVVDPATGKPVKEKGFYLFKNSWGTSSFGVSNPKGAGYGWISYKYVKEYGSGYTSDPPTMRP